MVDTAAVALELVPLLETTTSADDVWTEVLMEVEVVEAEEPEAVRLNTGALAMDCACEDEAGVDGFVDKEKPEKEPELPDAAAAFVTPNPVKELTAADVTAELAGAADEAVAEEDEELKLKAGNAGVEAVVVLAAGVEAVVVVTVENNGADDVPKDKEAGFDTAEPDNVGAGVDDEAALPNPYAG